MSEIRRICVFCGSSPGVRPIYVDAARELGRFLASARIGLVYGGASVGLMGAVADGALEAGGEVIGIIPQSLAVREIAHHGLTALHVVGSMHERKAMMADLSDAFIALPGGLGTLEEFFEVTTWAMIGLHRKPAGFLDVGGYWTGLTAFLDHVVDEGFLRVEHRGLALHAESAPALLSKLRAFEGPPLGKYLKPSER